MNAIPLSHKVRLQPTKRDETYFRKACGIARFTWNHALAEWIRQYQAGEQPNGFSLKKAFNAIKPTEFPWMYEVTKYASQQPFIHLQKSFQNFFKGNARYPKFKKKGIHDSFYIGNDHIQVKGKRIRLPKLGWVKMRESLRFKGRIQSATISRTADKWFVSLHVELAEMPEPCESQARVGVDLGIKQLATTFDGKITISVPGPKPLRHKLKKLKRAQRSLSAKQKGSKNRDKQRLKVAKLHYRIRCIRQDVLHKLTTALTKKYSVIAIEDLNVKGMLANHKLARSISDMGFLSFEGNCSIKHNVVAIILKLLIAGSHHRSNAHDAQQLK